MYYNSNLSSFWQVTFFVYKLVLPLIFVFKKSSFLDSFLELLDFLLLHKSISKFVFSLIPK